MVTPDARMATEIARLAAEESLRLGLMGPYRQAGPAAHDSPASFSPSPSGLGPAAGGGATIGGEGLFAPGDGQDEDTFEGEQRRVRRRSVKLLGLRRLEYGTISLGSRRPLVANTTYGMEAIADARMAEALMIYVRSTCNQAVTIQTVGGVTQVPDLDSVFNIEASQALAAGNVAQTVLALLVNLRDNWAPYLGITVAAGATAPTTGFVYATACLRFWQHID